MGTGGAVNRTSTGSLRAARVGDRTPEIVPTLGLKHSHTADQEFPHGELKAPLNGPHQSPESKTLFDLLTHTPNAARKNVCVSHCLRARDIYELINAPHGGAYTLRIENDDKRKVFGKAADRLQKDRLQHRKDAGAEMQYDSPKGSA